MKLDLRKDFADIYAHLVERVKAFNPKNCSPVSHREATLMRLSPDWRQSRIVGPDGWTSACNSATGRGSEGSACKSRDSE